MMFGSLRGFLKSRFSAFFGLFLIMWLLTVKNVEAIIYMGQSYSGWGFFGYGFDNLYWFYQNYAGWIDFLLFMGLFFAIIQQVFVKHLKFEKKTGKMLGVFLGAALSLGLIMFEYNHGIRLLESSAMMAFILIALVIASIVYGFVKKITGKKEGLSWIGLIVTIFVLILLWFAIASFTGLGSSRTAEAMLAGYSLGEFLDAAMTVLGIAMLLGLLFKFYSGDKGKGRLDATGDLAKKGLEGGGSFFGNLFGNLFGKTAKGVGEGIGAARRSGDRPGPQQPELYWGDVKILIDKIRRLRIEIYKGLRELIPLVTAIEIRLKDQKGVPREVFKNLEKSKAGFNVVLKYLVNNKRATLKVFVNLIGNFNDSFSKLEAAITHAGNEKAGRMLVGKAHSTVGYLETRFVELRNSSLNLVHLLGAGSENERFIDIINRFRERRQPITPPPSDTPPSPRRRTPPPPPKDDDKTPPPKPDDDIEVPEKTKRILWKCLNYLFGPEDETTKGTIRMMNTVFGQVKNRLRYDKTIRDLEGKGLRNLRALKAELESLGPRGSVLKMDYKKVRDFRFMLKNGTIGKHTNKEALKEIYNAFIQMQVSLEELSKKPEIAEQSAKVYNFLVGEGSPIWGINFYGKIVRASTLVNRRILEEMYSALKFGR